MLKFIEHNSPVIKEYRLSYTEKGEDVLHPFDGLALKAKQAKTGGSFYWNGNTYRVM